MKLKKLALLSSFIIGTSLVFTPSIQNVKSEERLEQKIEQEERIDIVHKSVDYYDNRSFDLSARIFFYEDEELTRGFDIGYRLQTDIEGKPYIETLDSDDSIFVMKKLKENGLIEENTIEPGCLPSISPVVKITYNHENDSLTVDLKKQNITFKRTGDKYWSFPEKTEAEVRENIRLGQEFFNEMKEILEIDKIKFSSKGMNHYQDIMQFDVTDLLKNEPTEGYLKGPKWASSETDYVDYYDLGPLWGEAIFIKKGKSHIQINFVDEKASQIIYSYRLLNSTIFKKDKFIRELYTQEEIDDMFNYFQDQYERVKDAMEE